MSDNKVRVFIGSGEASLLERKTLAYTILKHTKSDVDIYVFNGTHNAIEKNDEPPVPAGMSLRVKYKNFTEFSNYRFLIPEVCNYQGRAIFLDSDMLCLGDIEELFNAPMPDGTAILAKQEAYAGSGSWGLSVAVMDCSKCRFDLDPIFDEIAAGDFTYTDLHQLSPKFLEKHPMKVGAIDPNWNSFDLWNENTKLIHYTNLLTQPWKFPGHPFGELWFKYFEEARTSGYITKEDIEKTKVRSYVRQDILEGNSPKPKKKERKKFQLPSVRAKIASLIRDAKR